MLWRVSNVLKGLLRMVDTIEITKKQFIKLITHPAVKGLYTYHTEHNQPISKDSLSHLECEYIVFAGVAFVVKD